MLDLPLRSKMLAVRKRWQSTRVESDVARSTPRETAQMRCCSRLVSSFRLTSCRPPLIRGMGLAVRCVQEMLFKKAAAPEPCDEAPCGTGMAYLQPTYKRTVNEHAWHVPRMLACMLACMHARQACTMRVPPVQTFQHARNAGRHCAPRRVRNCAGG